MFSFITLNWRGRPLTSIRTIVELIAATTTKTGLTIQADHDPTEYPKGVKVSDAELAAIPLTRHDWHGDWNYTIRPHMNDKSNSRRALSAVQPWRVATRRRRTYPLRLEGSRNRGYCEWYVSRGTYHSSLLAES